MSVLDTLYERGFVHQLTHEEEIRELLAKEKITFYIGFDPTADSPKYFFNRLGKPHCTSPLVIIFAFQHFPASVCNGIKK